MWVKVFLSALLFSRQKLLPEIFGYLLASGGPLAKL
jgi:hypothetical protein